ETVPQVVANEADAHDHKREDDAGHRGDPPSGVEVIPAGGDRRPPAWRRSRRAEAEKAQRGLGYDHQPELERGYHEEWAYACRDDAAAQEVEAVRAESHACLDIFPLTHGQRLCPGDPG